MKESIDEFVNVYYFVLKDRYDEANILSMPSVTASITLDEKTKRIFHNQDSPAPKGLSGLEDRIDEITNANRWTGLQKKKEISECKHKVYLCVDHRNAEKSLLRSL